MFVYTYIVCIRMHCLYTHCLDCLYTHKMFVYTYIVCIHMHCLYTHTLFVYTYIVCIHMYCLYTHMSFVSPSFVLILIKLPEKQFSDFPICRGDYAISKYRVSKCEHIFSCISMYYVLIVMF